MTITIHLFQNMYVRFWKLYDKLTLRILENPNNVYKQFPYDVYSFVALVNWLIYAN